MSLNASIRSGLRVGLRSGINPVDSLLLATIAAQGLSVPLTAIDFSLKAAGSFANPGSAGGTLTPVGSPSYAQAFPEDIGGTGVSFPTQTADGFESAADAVSSFGTGAGTVMVVFKADSSANLDNLASNRETSNGNGWDLIFDNVSGRLRFSAEGGGTVEFAQCASNHADGNDHYVCGGVHHTGSDTVFAFSDLDAENAQTATAVSDYSSSGQTFKVGYDATKTSAIDGVVRYVIVWDVRITRTQAGNLFTALQAL